MDKPLWWISDPFLNIWKFVRYGTSENICSDLVKCFFVRVSMSYGFSSTEFKNFTRIVLPKRTRGHPVSGFHRVFGRYNWRRTGRGGKFRIIHVKRKSFPSLFAVVCESWIAVLTPYRPYQPSVRRGLQQLIRRFDICWSTSDEEGREEAEAKRGSDWEENEEGTPF